MELNGSVVAKLSNSETFLRVNEFKVVVLRIWNKSYFILKRGIVFMRFLDLNLTCF